MKLSINAISGPSAAIRPSPDRGHASGQPPPAAAAVKPPQAAAVGVGTVGLLSPSVLAALMGQDVKLFGSFSGD